MRYPQEIEASAYFLVSEALANVLKHASVLQLLARTDALEHALRPDRRARALPGRAGAGGAGRTQAASWRGVMMTPKAVAQIERLRRALAAGEPLPETHFDEEVIAA